MKKTILFVLLTLCGCTNRMSQSKKMVEVIFHPGFVEDCSHVDFPKNICAELGVEFEITPSEYASLFNILAGNREKTKPLILPPCIFVTFDTVHQYVLGNNRVVKAKDNFYVISEEEEYRVKSIVHYYDFFYEEDLASFPEVRKYGIPANYHHVLRNRNTPPKSFAKIILAEK